MKSRKKIIFNGVFLAVVFALTIYGVFHGEDLSSMMDAIHRADKRWLLPGVALVAFFIWGESIIIWYMMRSSGILPIVLGFKLGMCHIYGIAILLFYGLAGLIRLAYFNVMEEKRQNETSENRKYYQGLPITSMSVVLPLLFVVSLLFPEYKWFVVLLHIAMLTVGLLFILDFKFRKPTNRELVIIVAVVAVAVLLVLFYNEGWWKFNYLYKLSMERGGNL